MRSAPFYFDFSFEIERNYLSSTILACDSQWLEYNYFIIVISIFITIIIIVFNLTSYSQV